jgi:DNA polymerase III subunit delta'
MNFKWNTIGNERAVEFLDRSLSNDRVANFYIFSGIQDLGKFSLARDFIKNTYIKDLADLKFKDNFLETNSDFSVLEREEDKKNISIEQVRSLIGRFKSSSFLDSYRTAIIRNAEDLNENSSNALLKLLEESGDKTLVVLTVSDIDQLAKTIVSRAQLVNLFPVSDDLIYKKLVDEIGITPSLAKDLSKLSSGRPIRALKFAQDKELYSDYQSLVFDFLDLISRNFSERVDIIDKIVQRGPDFDIIEVWQSVLRDLIFMNYREYDQLKNSFALDRLKAVDLGSFNLAEIKKKVLIMGRGKEYLRANISLRSSLEYIAVNL